MRPSPFSQPVYPLATCTLTRLQPDDAEPVATVLAAMDPWLRLGYGAPALARYLGGMDTALHRYVARAEGNMLGIIGVRFPWLRGPYLEMLAVFPEAQGQGVGGQMVHWMESEARTRAANLWVAVSEFNTHARGFYASMGFAEATVLPGLVKPGFSELLLRKELMD